jgi:anti-anti-sigma factor
VPEHRQAELIVSQQDAVPVLCVRGEVDLANAGQLERALNELASGHPPVVVLSLYDAVYFDSSIAHVLFRSNEQLRRDGTALFVVRPSRSSGQRVYNLLELSKLIRSFDSLEDALAASRPA